MILINKCGINPKRSQYNTSYTKRHPDLYKFINILKREVSLASIKYFRAISGYEADKRKKKEIEKDLKNRNFN